MKKVLAIISLFFVIAFDGLTQQMPQYSQRPFHQFSLNPALAGINTCVDMRMLYRQQWIGIPQAPSGGFFTLSARLKSKNNKFMAAYHGIGFKFERDALGPFAHNRLQLAYALHLPLKRDLTLSLGAYAGIDNMTFDPTRVSSIDPDPAVQTSAYSFLGPDATFGAWLTGKNYFVGMTLQNLIPLDYAIGIEASKRFHFYLNGGMRIKLNDQGLSLLPVLMMRIPPKGPMGIDIHAMMDFKNTLTFGVGYRRQESVLFLARFKFLGYFTLGYSFDLITNRLKGNIGHTHEISIGVSTCKQKSTAASVCPIFE
jgi:type IX secretion system PorP/SprF family membrane protein